MDDLYRKLYATLMGRVNDTIDYLDLLVSREQCTREAMASVSNKLKLAVLEAEETYIAPGGAEPK